jgi:hypothetical protein
VNWPWIYPCAPRLPDADDVEGHVNPDGDEQADDLLFVESFRNVTKVPRDFSKARKRPRPITDVTTVLVHQTAVTGGFGVSRRLLRQHDGDAAEARQARYRRTPYHGLYSPRDRASIVQWPAWVYGYHGNGANRYSVGWAYDGKLPGDELDAEGARESLRHFVECMREAGAPLLYVEAHRQHSDQRGGDPGEQIWREVVRPLFDELGLEERPTHTTGPGLELPNSWRE